MRPLVALALLAALAGCASPEEAPAEAAPVETAAEPEPAAEAVAEPAEPEPGAFPPRETTIRVGHYATATTPAGRRDTGNMDEAEWELAVPEGATRIRVRAEWTPSTPLSAAQTLMVHNGTRAETTEMLGEGATGPSPLETAWIDVPAGVATLVVMCHVDGQAAAEVAQETRLVAEFL